MKFILKLLLSAGLLFLGATVLQDMLITFAPYFGVTYDFKFTQVFVLFLLSSGVFQIVTAERFADLLERLNPKEEQPLEEILSKKIGVAVAMLLVWLEFWFISLIVL